jgi:TolA-binding protein
VSPRWLRGLVLVVALAVAAAEAQTPPPTCPDQLRAAQLQLQATVVSQLRERGDAAREIVMLQKRIEELQAEVAKLATPKDPTKEERR